MDPQTWARFLPRYRPRQEDGDGTGFRGPLGPSAASDGEGFDPREHRVSPLDHKSLGVSLEIQAQHRFRVRRA